MKEHAHLIEGKYFGVCDFSDCPHWRDGVGDMPDGCCTYHPNKCFIDEETKNGH